MADGYFVVVEVPCGGGGTMLWGVLRGGGVLFGGGAPPCAGM